MNSVTVLPADKTQQSYLGKHLIVEFWGASNISDADSVEKALVLAARKAGATLLKSDVHDFGDGMGVTGVVMLAESHISIHTWPERKYAALDVFVCGDHTDPYLAIKSMEKDFIPTQVEITEHRRGVQ